MNKYTFSKVTLAAVSTLLSAAVMASPAKNYPGFVAHGINTYNGSPIGDYSQVAPGVGMLNSATPILEIGAKAADGSPDAEHISPYTDRSTPLATTRSFFDFFVPGGEIDTSTVNVTLDQIGTNYFGFSAIDDRVKAESYDMASNAPSIYRAKGVNVKPTVGDWEAISGKMTTREKRDGTTIVKITIRDGIPNSLYTLWDVGVKNPSTEEAGGYAVPLGGIPNAMITNAKGCGYKEIEMNYSPSRSCDAGEESCSAYVSVFYHWDAQVYGGAPAGTWSDIPTGIYAGNQMVFPTSGDLKQKPVTKMSKRRHGCGK